MSNDINADIKAAVNAVRPKDMELNCHVEILEHGIRFSYSGAAEDLVQKGAKMAAEQLWDKLYLIFLNPKWHKKYGVKDVKEFFYKYKAIDIFNGSIQ